MDNMHWSNLTPLERIFWLVAFTIVGLAGGLGIAGFWRSGL